MKKVSKPILVTVLILFFLAGINIIFSLVFIRRILEVNQSRVDRLVPVYSQKPLVQFIHPKNNGLNVVMIFLKNKSLTNNDPFIFNLIDSNNKIIRTISLRGSNIGDGETVRFQFEPIIDSADQIFVLQLLAPSTTVPNTPIEVGYSNSKVYPTINGNEVGDMSFQLYFRPTYRLYPITFEISHIIHQLNPLYGISLVLSLSLCAVWLKLVK